MINISGSRGTTFIRCSLAIATSLGTYDFMGRRSTYPITGITDKVYFRQATSTGAINLAPTQCLSISSCSIRVFFAGCLLWAFHQWPTLWMQRNLLLVPSTLCVIQLFLCVMLKIPSNQGRVNSVFLQGMCVRV